MLSMFDHSILCVRHCKDVVTPLCLDARLPVDTLYMVFEEDYRFFPEGQDPDGIDDYKKGVGGRESWRRRELAEEGVGGGGSWRGRELADVIGLGLPTRWPRLEHRARDPTL